MTARQKTVYPMHPIYTPLAMAGSLAFVIMGIWVNEIGCALFFGAGLLAFLWPFFHPGYRVLFEGSKKYKEYVRAEQEARIIEPGIFRYTEEGFVAEIDGMSHPVMWAEIKAVFAYTTSYCVCIDIVTADYDILTVSEATDGWYVFSAQLHWHFPSIDRNLEDHISGDDFASSLTLAFEKEKDELIHNYYYGGAKEAGINPDEYPPYGSDLFSRLMPAT